MSGLLSTIVHPRPGLLRLRRDRAGSITYIGIVLVVLVIMFCGFAVDLMRVEHKRVRLQGAMDSGVLAAADAAQTRDRAQVVRDYMAVAGYDGFLEQPPQTDDGVRASAAAYMRPMFWHNAFGRDGITFRVASQAVNRRAEVSLVLDISYSMADPALDEFGFSTGRSKISVMRGAATRFLEILLTDDVRNQVSVSLVPYSGQANLGPYLFDSLQTDQLHRYSFCVDLPESAYGGVGLDLTQSYPQVVQAQFFPNRENGSYHDYSTRYDMSYPICPSRGAERITAFSQDLDALTQQVRALRPHGGTAIHVGLKWGAFLLDPTATPVRQAMQRDGVLDPAFAARPLPYDRSAVFKTVVLMTDGQNDGSYWRPLAEHTDTQAEIDYFAQTNFGWHFDILEGGGYWDFTWLDQTRLLGGYLRQSDAAAAANRMMASVCDAAKARGIVIYAVAVEVQPQDVGPMRACATSPAHFFPVTGADLDRAFSAIAQDIRALRLVQ